MIDTIQLPSGVLVIIDPSYLAMYNSILFDVSLQVRKLSVFIDTKQTGEVDILTVISNEGGFGERVAGTKLIFNTERKSKERKKLGDCGVDSGRLIFFDKSNLSILQQCSCVNSDELSEYSHVTSTGFGDGLYPVFVEYDAYGNINSIEVIFLAEKCERCGTSLMEGNKLCFKCDLLDRS